VRAAENAFDSITLTVGVDKAPGVIVPLALAITGGAWNLAVEILNHSPTLAVNAEVIVVTRILDGHQRTCFQMQYQKFFLAFQNIVAPHFSQVGFLVGIPILDSLDLRPVE
jgi:hypothetical protein